MNLSFEALLVIGLLGFYLYDSISLVYSNQLIFTESYGAWGFNIPSSRWRILGKLIYIANPFTPHYQTFIVTWPTNGHTSNHKVERLPSISGNLTFLRMSVSLLMYLMLMVLPAVTYKLGLGSIALLVLILIYLIISGMVFFLFKRRYALNLSLRQASSMAFEIASCPPFAINLLRRLSLRLTLVEEPIEFAKKVLDQEEYTRFKEQFHQKLSDELELEEDENSPRSICLIKYRDKLMEPVI